MISAGVEVRFFLLFSPAFTALECGIDCLLHLLALFAHVAQLLAYAVLRVGEEPSGNLLSFSAQSPGCYAQILNALNSAAADQVFFYGP